MLPDKQGAGEARNIREVEFAAPKAVRRGMEAPASLKRLLFTALMLCIGLVGGLLASRIGAPMPFMLGALLLSGMAAVFAGHLFPRGYVFPARFRLLFIGVIGVAIGARVDPGILHLGGAFMVSLGAVTLFVVLAQGANYLIFLHLGGLDAPTAWFSGSPGGLLEALTMGEAAGADLPMLTMLQFLRIIVVVSLLPIGFSIWNGAPVGSAAGLSAGVNGADGPGGLALLLAVAAVGAVVGMRLRIPAGQLIGPLVLAGVLGWSTGVSLGPPGWLMAAAQVVVGVSLGVRFHGVGGALIAKALRLSLVSVTSMLAIGAGLAFAVHAQTGLALDALIIAYAPGGMTEMGLVAISLSASPAMVALHHLYRITITVIFLSMARRLGVLAGAKQAEPDPHRNDR